MESKLISTAPQGATSPSPISRKEGMTGWAWLLLPGTMFLVVLFVLPLFGLLLLAFGMPNWTLENFTQIGTDAAYMTVLATTVKISMTATALAFVLGYPIAYVLSTSGSGLRTFIQIAVVLPYFTSALGRTFSWIILLGRSGVINSILLKAGIITEPLDLLYNRFSVIIGMTHIVMPLMILPMATVMSNIDQRLVRAAKANGAGPLASFVTIFFPLSLPGVAAGILLVFIYCLGFYVTPALLGGLSDMTITMEISTQVVELLNWNLGSALAIVLLAAVLIALWVASRLFPIEQLLGFSSDKESASPKQQRLGNTLVVNIGAIANLIDRWLPSFASRSVPIIACVIAAVALLLPVLITVYLSFSSASTFVFPAPGYSLHNYRAYLDDPLWISATITSIRVALMATAMATVLGTLLAFGLTRGRTPGRRILVALVLSPIILPTIVVAIATYFVLARVGLQGTEFGLALGHAVHALPFVVVIVVSNLKGLNPAYEKAARSLGAGPAATFRTIIAPLVMPSLIVAAFFAFLGSFDDVVYVLFLGIGRITTLPIHMWASITQGTNPTIAAVASLQIAFAALAIIVSSVIRRRKRI